jgi:hypothetical protein
MRYLLIGFLLAAPAVYPQTSPAPTASAPQALALATQALSALTGSVQVDDVTLTGTATRTAGSDVATGSVSLKALAGGEARLDLTVAGGTRSEIRNLDSNGAPQGFWIGLDGLFKAPLPALSFSSLALKMSISTRPRIFRWL